MQPERAPGRTKRGARHPYAAGQNTERNEGDKRTSEEHPERSSLDVDTEGKQKKKKKKKKVAKGVYRDIVEWSEAQA